ncbi:MAG: hypothetical protein QUS33_06590 [Dehalococcoidia bacterium]|nr:hypothetical protein [Dehalococcoidia bacterium]
MGIAYSVDKERGVSYEAWVGTITGKDWVEHVRRQVADPEWPAGDRSLTDLQLLSSDSSVGKAEVDEVVALYKAQPAKLAQGRAAVVAGKDFQLSPLFRIFTSRHGFRLIVFNDMALACKWLGLDLGEAERSIARLRAKLAAESAQQLPHGS